MGVIMFNGVSSRDFGIQVETPPDYQSPERDYESIYIPGKNGNVIIDNGSYKNTTRTYKISVGKSDGDFTTLISGIMNWMHSASGYARLEDSYEPDYYRLASYSESTSITNIFGRAGRATISFNCKPQRYLKVGEESVRFTSAGVLANRTNFEARPIIKVNAARNYTLVTFNEQYNLVTTEPGDWDVDYTSYYTRSGDIYTQIPSGVSYDVVNYSDTYLVTHNYPDDWETNYTSYYTRSETEPYVYTPVPLAESEPLWEDNLYFKKHTEPLDWQTDYTAYYTRSGSSGAYVYTPVPESTQAPTWTNNRYFKKTEIIPAWDSTLYYRRLTEPSDWQTSYYTNYYTRSGSVGSYVYTLVSKSENAPTWTNNTYYRLNKVTATINIGRYSIDISDVKGSMTIDCELQDAYSDTENRNLDITVPNGFPKLVPGNNNITFTGQITSLEVIPRWWTL